MEKRFKSIVEKHPDGYVAYPLGLKGVVVGEGNTYEEALTDVKSAIKFHIDTFGQEVIEDDCISNITGTLRRATTTYGKATTTDHR
jgi:predicted RNase H-like HicB family nuclease